MVDEHIKLFENSCGVCRICEHYANIGQFTYSKAGRASVDGVSRVFCDKPYRSNVKRECERIEAHFIIRRQIGGGFAPEYLVQLDDGRLRYIITLSGTHTEKEHKARMSAETECLTRGQPTIGMTRLQLYGSCWGQPNRVNATTTAAGDFEQLVYWRGYIYLENGVVRAIQEAR